VILIITLLVVGGRRLVQVKYLGNDPMVVRI
jgi:hypothetical protein